MEEAESRETPEHPHAQVGMHLCSPAGTHSEALPSPALCSLHPQTLDTNSEHEAPYLHRVLPIYFLIRERLFFPLTRSLMII